MNKALRTFKAAVSLVIFCVLAAAVRTAYAGPSTQPVRPGKIAIVLPTADARTKMLDDIGIRGPAQNDPVAAQGNRFCPATNKIARY